MLEVVVATASDPNVNVSEILKKNGRRAVRRNVIATPTRLGAEGHTSLLAVCLAIESKMAVGSQVVLSAIAERAR